MEAQSLQRDLLTITEAANIAPGRPSTNCVWRWCRRGVKGRNGERIRLEHRRIGGKIFTALSWLEEFGRRLAEADSKYFELYEAATEAVEARPQRMPTRQSVKEARRRQEIEQANLDLEEAGI